MNKSLKTVSNKTHPNEKGGDKQKPMKKSLTTRSEDQVREAQEKALSWPWTWYVADKLQSCDQQCTMRNLTCDELALKHTDRRSRVLNAVKYSYASWAKPACNDKFGYKKHDYPGWVSKGACMVSSQNYEKVATQCHGISNTNDRCFDFAR